MEDACAKKPWMKFYDAQVMNTLEYPRMFYARAAGEDFGRFPERLAFYNIGGEKFGDLHQLSSQLSRFLIKSGWAGRRCSRRSSGQLPLLYFLH